MKTYYSIDINKKLNIFIEIFDDIVYINKMNKETLLIETITEISLDNQTKMIK